MKLTNEDVSCLREVLDIGALGGIEVMLIKNGGAYGANAAKTFAMLTPVNFPATIGISRLNELRQRLNLFKDAPTIEAKEGSSGSDIASLEMSSGRTKVQFRCTSPILLDRKVPSELTPSDFVASITITPSEVKQITEGTRIMGAKKISLVLRRTGESSLEATDSTHDTFKVELETPTVFEDDPESIVNYYASDVFLPVIRKSAESGNSVELVLKRDGTLTVQLGSFEVVLLARIDEDYESEED